MRTVKTNITMEERGKLEEMSKNTKLKESFDIVEDIFSFMKEPSLIDEGSITDSLVDEFVNGKFEYYLHAKNKVKGRIEFFNRILTHPYYEKLKSNDPMKSAETMLKILDAFYREKEKPENGQKEKEEKSAEEKAFEKIIRYGKELFDLLDDEWFKTMVKHQMGGDGKTPEAKDMAKYVNDVTQTMKRQIKIYELSQKLEFTIRVSKKGKYNETQFPDSGLDVARIKKVRDIVNILPSQYAFEEDLFLLKLAKKELLKKKFMQRQEKRQILYMIVDSSGSMSDHVIDGLSKIDVCKAITITLMKKMIENEDMFFFRWFTTSCSDLVTVKTKEEAKKFLIELVYGRPADGGTNIQYAIEVASKDIKAKTDKKMDMADILLVSDGMAELIVQECNQMLDKIDMHTVMITPEKLNKQDSYHSNLIQISKNLLLTKCDKDTDIIEIANIFTR